MIGDILTVASKEWRELLFVGGGLRSGRVSLVILLFMFGVFMPYQIGPEWLDSPTTLFYWGWLPLMIVAGAVAKCYERLGNEQKAREWARRYTALLAPLRLDKDTIVVPPQHRVFAR